MAASQIINRGFKEKFLTTRKRTVLVPGCMRPDNGIHCKASHEGVDIRCTSCSDECGINQLQEKVNENGGELFIVPHTSGFSKWLKRWENSSECGIVASACPLNIVVGGYEMRRLNIPSQCVMLDTCGCQKHWDSQGTSTEINNDRIIDVMLNGA